MYLLLVTARESRGDVVAGLDAGADDYIIKPFDPEELRARVAVGVRVLGLQQKLAERVDGAADGAIERQAAARAAADLQLLQAHPRRRSVPGSRSRATSRSTPRRSSATASARPCYATVSAEIDELMRASRGQNRRAESAAAVRSAGTTRHGENSGHVFSASVAHAGDLSVWQVVHEFGIFKRLGRRRRDEAEGVAADIHVGDGLLDLRHVAADALAARRCRPCDACAARWSRCAGRWATSGRGTVRQIVAGRLDQVGVVRRCRARRGS